MKQFGFIGMGNMGYAILKGLLKSKVPDQIIFSARNKEHMEQVAAETGVSYAADNRTCAKESACLVLAVKPQQFDTVIGEIRDPDLPKGYEAGPSDPFVNLRTGGFALHLPY